MSKGYLIAHLKEHDKEGTIQDEMRMVLTIRRQNDRKI